MVKGGSIEERRAIELGLRKAASDIRFSSKPNFPSQLRESEFDQRPAH
jgi:hypothetical protein